MRRILAFVAALLVAGCTKPVTTPPPIPQPPLPVETTAPVEESDGRPGASLFPAADLDVELWVWDMGSPQAGLQVEQRLREGNRVAVVQNGRPAFTWLLEDTGIWREDPSGGGVLLRYLPPILNKDQAWHQKSGDATVWFRLRTSPDCQECWRLSVLNRGQEITYTFAPGSGPTNVRAVSTEKPENSFLMQRQEPGREGSFPADQRAGALEKAAPRTTARAAVTAVTPADYEAARTEALRLETRQADLDGDGRPEHLQGVFGQWTVAELEGTAPDGKPMAVLSPYLWAQRVEVVRFGRQDLLLVWQQGPGGEMAVGLQFPVLSEGRWGWGTVYGWGVKHATTTPATRARWDESGLLTVEWDMGDPAGHTRIRRYRVLGEGTQRSVTTTEKDEFRPQAGALRYPTDAKGVLEAAWTAHWYGIPNELRTYFASDAAAEAFRTGIHALGYGGGITLGAPGQVPAGCPYKFTPGDPGPDGTATFLVEYPGLWYDEAWGTVRFAQTTEDRLLIEAFKLVDHRACQP